ncbi:hypothetical protein [Vibrio sp.]|uniref:hypothetical protein n=1 Tax=Vibrio sp. TaxID=678 RepID=UPI003AA8578D
MKTKLSILALALCSTSAFDSWLYADKSVNLILKAKVIQPAAYVGTGILPPLVSKPGYFNHGN